MAAAVASMPQPLLMADSSTAEARKRRREILTSQRIMSPDAVFSAAALTPSVATSANSNDCVATAFAAHRSGNSIKRDEVAPAKRQKVTQSSTRRNGKPAKKPQMKYDPEEPMTKEEATVWRREQRRKRNRESAAASRQRQRDRITELEAEVEDWKIKYDETMAKITHLENLSAPGEPKSTTLVIESPSKFVSPNTSPNHSPLSSPVASPVSSQVVVDEAQATPGDENTKQIKKVEEMEGQYSDKMMSRLAAS